MTDEDKNLLELAAKAAGLPDYFEGMVSSTKDASLHVWNPLQNDGDALQLAVKLHLSVKIWAGSSLHKQGVTIVEHDNVVVEFLHNSDPYTATRRAIVHAAAEIGKAHQ